LVGSLSLPSAEDAFELVATVVGSAAKRIPDGETGVRNNWVAWQIGTMTGSPYLQEMEPPTASVAEYWQAKFLVKPGISASDVRFDDLGYARVALESYAKFSRLKSQGRIGKDVRFQVSLPTPLPLLAGFIGLRDQAALEAPMQAALLREMNEIARAVAPDELAIQWDVAAEIAVLETDFFETHLKGNKQGIIDRLAWLGNAVPVNVELGYHLCYGNAGQKHFKEPADTGLMVEIANGIFDRLRRPVNWIHMPVPIDRDDDAYFAPLSNLSLPPGTDLFLGLLHHGDGVAGAARRMATASRHVSHYGVASECGLSGRTPQWTGEMLTLHRQVAEA